MNACEKCVFAVDDDKPHCGLRGFRSDFNVEYCSAENDTIPNGYELQEDGYFSWVNKKKYPKTYEECCKIIEDCADCSLKCFACGLLNTLQKLLVCREAYWQIAGEEMGLGKPWSPSDNNKEPIHAITRYDGYIIKDESGGNDEVLEFPTKEMRDAFQENFDPDIEICKELL
jgi:hypothetical protein